jgi:hypothetical protein
VNVIQQAKKYEIKEAKTFTIQEWLSGDMYRSILDITDHLFIKKMIKNRFFTQN